MNEKGFTLVEVVISILLIGVIAVAILPMFFQGVRVLFSSESKTSAINKAKEDVINNYIKSNPPAASTSITFDFGGGTTKTINANSYATTPQTYKTPNQEEDNLIIEYYVYDSE